MKSGKILIAAALLLFFTAGVFGGMLMERNMFKGPEEKPFQKKEFSKENIVQKMTEDLSLTPEQAEKVTAIFEEYGPQMDAIRDEIKERISDLHKKVDAEIEAVLTEEQVTEFRRQLEIRKKKYEHGDRDGKDRKHKDGDKHGDKKMKDPEKNQEDAE